MQVGQRQASLEEAEGIASAAAASWSAFDVSPSRVDAARIALSNLLEMTPDERLVVLREFCRGCGSHDNRCQCWNDD